MRIGVLGAGGCFAQDFTRYVHSLGIDTFGIGRSRKDRPFWLVHNGYRYHVLHLGKDLHKVMTVLDIERPDVIVNYAAQGEGAASFGDNAPDFFRTNCVALLELQRELSKRSYLRRFVHIGSSEVYGSPDEPATEKTAIKATSPYAWSKVAFDGCLESFWRTEKFPMNIVRPSNCYVEGQQLHRIIPKAILCALKGEKLPLHGGGRAVKSYLHARDLSRAVMRVIADAPFGTTYNVGPDHPIAIREVVALIAGQCGIPFDRLVEDVSERVGQDAKYHLDSSAIKALGWRQEIMLGEGIERMIAWVRAFPELLTLDTRYIHKA